ncbi:MAG: hypothetical protein ACPLQP_01890 [Moorellaceae bacterium]
MAKTGSTFIQWDDYTGFFIMETSSEKLVETLSASGIRWLYKDGETGLYRYKLPTAWLRLRTRRGLLRLGWYPNTNQRKQGVLALYEERPPLQLVKG